METKVIVNNEGGVVKAFENEIQVGQIDFIFIEGGLSIEHTRTFEGHQGKGVASALMQATNEYAIAQQLKVKPTCSYAEAWYQRRPEFQDVVMPDTRTKVFVMETCPDCTQVKAQLAGNPNYQIIDIGQHIKNLKQFLALRDKDAAFHDAKAHGYAGIPAFLLPDGTVKFSLDEITLNDSPAGEACSLDGKAC